MKHVTALQCPHVLLQCLAANGAPLNSLFSLGLLRLVRNYRFARLLRVCNTVQRSIQGTLEAPEVNTGLHGVSYRIKGKEGAYNCWGGGTVLHHYDKSMASSAGKYDHDGAVVTFECTWVLLKKYNTWLASCRTGSSATLSVGTLLMRAAMESM